MAKVESSRWHESTISPIEGSLFLPPSLAAFNAAVSMEEWMREFRVGRDCLDICSDLVGSLIVGLAKKAPRGEAFDSVSEPPPPLLFDAPPGDA